MSSVLHEQASHYAAVRARLMAPSPFVVERPRPVVRSVPVRPEGYVKPQPPKPPVQVLTSPELSKAVVDLVVEASEGRCISAPPVSVMQIIKAVSRKHGVSVSQMIGKSRERYIVAARHEAFYRLKQETNLSLPRIGQRFGDRDHTTVMSGIRRHIKRMAARDLLEMQGQSEITTAILHSPQIGACAG